jgi:1,4-dihydroxy-2-naphthoate octaprenyltransferase
MAPSLRTTILSWWQASRYHFIPPSLFPAAIGSIVSWASFDSFFLPYFILVIVGVTINHVALNMTDDYFDYKHAVDQTKPGEKNPYSGGSGTLTSGLIQPKNMFSVFLFLYMIVIGIGLYLSIQRGFFVLIFGLIGIFWSVFYTSPPIQFAHHGLGEIGLLLNFGPTIGLGAFFVQAQVLSLEAFFATLPSGIMLFSMIIINEIPDIEEDRLAGKLTLVARYGKKAGVKIYIASWFATYCVILSSVLLGFLPIFVLLSFISLPFVIDSMRILTRNYQDTQRLIPANIRMIHAHALTSIGMIAGYIWYGFYEGKDLFEVSLFSLILLVLYLPALLPPIHLKNEKNLS